MVDKLKPLVPLVGKTEYEGWEAMASGGRISELFERVMVSHYDPCYTRSMSRNYGVGHMDAVVNLDSLAMPALMDFAKSLVLKFPFPAPAAS